MPWLGDCPESWEFDPDARGVDPGHMYFSDMQSSFGLGVGRGLVLN